ncbi:Protein of unknown function [Gryllus bimaculatus]|nr:Protein of unknown function [Gryllus bimaculatus]
MRRRQIRLLAKCTKWPPPMPSKAGLALQGSRRRPVPTRGRENSHAQTPITKARHLPSTAVERGFLFFAARGGARERLAFRDVGGEGGGGAGPSRERAATGRAPARRRRSVTQRYGTGQRAAAVRKGGAAQCGEARRTPPRLGPACHALALRPGGADASPHRQQVPHANSLARLITAGVHSVRLRDGRDARRCGSRKWNSPRQSRVQYFSRCTLRAHWLQPVKGTILLDQDFLETNQLAQQK